MPRIHNARVILEDQILNQGWVGFESGTITGIGQDSRIPTNEDIDAQGVSRTEKVEEAALADVWRTEDREADSRSYDLAPPVVLQDRLYLIP